MKTAIILAAALAATSASAQFLTGNELLTRLSSDNPHERGSAFGYVMGAYDAGRGVAHCAPAGVTLGQVTDMVKQTLQIAPAARHNSAEAFVTYALLDAWPCSKKRPGNNL